MNTAVSAVFEVRRENLRRLVLDKFEGNRAAFSRAAGVHQNQVNLLLTDNDAHRRNLGEGLARKIEGTLGLVDGYLDVPNSGRFTEETHLVRAIAIPPGLSEVLRADDQVHSVCYHKQWLQSYTGQVTSLNNLAIAIVTTHDLHPEVKLGDRVMIDTGVKAVTADGVYILQRNSDTFLRRMTKQVTGGWYMSVPPTIGDKPIHVDSLKGIKAAGRVLAKIAYDIL